VDCEGLKKRIKKHHNFHGNSDWSTSAKHYENTDTYITYMTKGILDPVWNYNHSTNHLNALKLLWVNVAATPSPLRHAAQAASLGEAPRVASTLTLNEQYQAYLDELLEHVSTMSPNLTLDSFRGPSLLYWRKRNGGLLPQTSTYKRFLASLYLEYRDHKRLPLAEEAIQDISKFYA